MKKEKIAVISPSKKYIGGIYHFTQKIAFELSKFYDVLVIAFDNQYPNFIYPGKVKKSDMNPYTYSKMISLMNWYNPITWQKTIQIIKNQDVEVVYIPWWTIALAFPILYIVFFLSKLKIKIIIEFHNIFDHDANKINRTINQFILTQLLKCSSLNIVHTKENYHKLHRLKQSTKIIKIPLGKLDIFNNSISKEELFKKYKLDPKLKYILQFGLVRKYKGLKYSIESLKYLNDFPNYTLLVVGDIWYDISEEKKIIKKHNLHEKVIFISKFIPDREIKTFFKISDIIIYPYINATQSGSLSLAFELKKPVICTKVGEFREIIRDNTNGLLISPKNSKDLANALVSLIKNRELYQKIGFNGYEYYKNELAWNKIIEKLTSNFSK